MAAWIALLIAAATALAQAQEPVFQGRHGGFVVTFSNIARNKDSTWKGAMVTVTGPGNRMAVLRPAEFFRTDKGTIAVEGKPCRIDIATVSDKNGMDAGWSLTLVPTDKVRRGCAGLPAGMGGTYLAF